MPLTEANLIFNQELAAWVQAIGSVIAIFVAVGIPLYFDRKQHRDEQHIEENQKQKFLITLLPTLYRLRNSTQLFLENFQYSRIFFKNSFPHSSESSTKSVYTISTKAHDILVGYIANDNPSIIHAYLEPFSFLCNTQTLVTAINTETGNAIEENEIYDITDGNEMRISPRITASISFSLTVISFSFAIFAA